MDMLMPHKPGEAYKVDTFLALLYALAIYIRGTAEPYQEESIYNTMKPFMV
jgi:hypothetical protein